MADLLRITTPVINQNATQPAGKQPVDPSAAFDLHEVNRVVRPQQQSELQGQNNGLIEQDSAPTILMDMLKDPSVSVNFLKNIFLLQEIIRLLPANNKAVTQEIETLFDSLMVSPEEIVPEMIRQENNSTAFKGELFDFLRQISREKPGAEMQFAVANLLKSINCQEVRGDILNAVSNSLRFLSESLSTSRAISDELSELSERFLSEDAGDNFSALKGETFRLLSQVEESILFSPKMAKVVSMVYYNLSRFNDNPDFFQEAVSSVLMLLDGKQQKTEFLQQIRAFLEGKEQPDKESSRIMDVLAKLIGRETRPNRAQEPFTLMGGDKVERIIHSLLSSPCNFTPLLHYVIPVDYMNMKSFAEVWINPNGSEDERPKGQRQNIIHMLVVFDIQGIGQFEAELVADEENKRIDLSLRCPPDYVDEFSVMTQRLSQVAKATSYSFGEISIDKLDRGRSLMDVFKSLPYKRTGVNVRI